MFSPSVIVRNIARVERQMRSALGNPKFRIVRFPRPMIEEMCAHLAAITDKQSSKFIRPLTREEQSFIDNELILSQLDFRHFCENYATIQLAPVSAGPEGWDELKDGESATGNPAGGGGSIGKFLLNGMQEVLLMRLAEIEDECYAARDSRSPVPGIYLILHKARALGASLFWQVVGYHRTRFYSHINGLTASIDQTDTERMHSRYQRVHDNLPAWMQPPVKFWPKDAGVVFENGSRMELQNGSQNKDLGRGDAWHFFHVTECALFERPEDHFDDALFPATQYDNFFGGIPLIGGMESTSKGKLGWWYEFVTQVMTGTAEGGAGRFRHFFAPFYLIDATASQSGQTSKYRLDPPLDWEPAPTTILMAEKVWETSAQFTVDHSSVRLAREVMYWYERTRAQYYRKGKLNIFLQNYPVDPDESFQHTSAGGFPNETIERLSLNCSRYHPYPYELRYSDIPDEAVVAEYSDLPMLSAGKFALVPLHPNMLDKDPRGIVYLWELPDARYEYACAADPTGGITGWSREFRQHNDIATDNAACLIGRKGGPAHPCEKCNGKGWVPTQHVGVSIECFTCDGRGKLGGGAVQVAEYAAPIDAEIFADLIWALSKIFVGSCDMDECQTIVEANNTGLLTIRKLQNIYRHSNLYQQQTLTGTAPKFLNGVGWQSSPQSVAILHPRSRAILMRRDFEVRSHFLVKELRDSIVRITGNDPKERAADNEKMPALIARERLFVPPGSGRHDDRMVAVFLLLWILFPWTDSEDMDAQLPGNSQELPPAKDFAASDASVEQQSAHWNEIVERFLGIESAEFGHYDDCAPNCTATHGLDEENVQDFADSEDDLAYFDDDY